jgi:hypothetical protein
MKRTWRERTMRLQHAIVVTFDGPGRDWVCIMRGTREEPAHGASPRRFKSGHRRREGGA